MPRKKSEEGAPQSAGRPSEAMRLVKLMRARFKSEDVALLMGEGGFARVKEVCPTGIEVLDRHVIGIGGLPYGRGVELKGEESSGKTTLLNRFMAAAQKDGCTVALADAEEKFDPSWATLHGVNLAEVVQMRADTLENFQEEAMFIVEKQKRCMIALDSIASIATKNELVEGKYLPAEHARLWSQFLRPFKQLVREKQALVVFVNQMRMKIGVMFGNPETTFAGNALKHFYSLRLNVSHGKTIKEEGVHQGRYMHVRADKNHMAPPLRSAALKLTYTEGFDEMWSTINYAKDVGCLEAGETVNVERYNEALANLGWAEKAEEPK